MPGHLVHRIGAEADVRRRRHAVALAEIDEVLERRVRFLAHLLERAFAAVGVRIDRARVHEHEILEVAGEHALHPQQRMQAAAARSADDEYRGLRFRIRFDRSACGPNGWLANTSSTEWIALLGFAIVVADVDAQGRDRAR